MHIFISYAKLDTRALAFKLRDALNVLPDVTAWMDESLEPGESWAFQIQQEINAADYVVVLLSPDVNRPQPRSFVLNEIDYAQQLKKPIIPIMAQKTVVPLQIAGIQYIDFTGDHETGMNRLIRRIAPRAGIPISDVPLTPSAGIKSYNPSLSSKFYRRPVFVIVIVVFIVVILTAVLLPNLSQPQTNATLSTNVALNPSDMSVPTRTQNIVMLTLTATSEPTLTPAPTLEIAFVAQTLDANATLEQATLNAQSTGSARATAYANGTQGVIDQTATAAFWTATPATNMTASAEAYRTQQGGTATAQYIDGQTASATFWMVTPTQTLTPTSLGYPGIPVTHNSDWMPVYQTFDGVEMALVPLGCFTMGMENASTDDQEPPTKICFDKPFWIDKTEVTQAQFKRFDGIAANAPVYIGTMRPIENISWFEARDYCVDRNARLPTEAEWEYAARGPDNWIYPWGNTFGGNKVVYSVNSNGQDTYVGSKPAGASWVGALDMSGNVWEWLSTIYKPYPYDANDGRESMVDITSKRVLHGGSANPYYSEPDRGLQASFRGVESPNIRANNVGFRCAHDY